MPRFRIYVAKRGSVEIDAQELDIASEKAQGLPDSAFAWEARDIEDCEEIDGNGR